MDWKNPYLVVTFGVFLALVGNSIFSGNDDVEQPPRVDIDSVSFFPSTFTCNYYSDFEVTYKVSHISGKRGGFGQPYYLFVNQTENTCLENFTFFNSTPAIHGLCSNTFDDGEKIESCEPKFEPIFEKTIKVKSNLNNLTYTMMELFKNNSIRDCKISEQVQICVELDGIGHCSDIKTANIEYVGCKGPVPF